jgi:hypothetical protein
MGLVTGVTFRWCCKVWALFEEVVGLAVWAGRRVFAVLREVIIIFQAAGTAVGLGLSTGGFNFMELVIYEGPMHD